MQLQSNFDEQQNKQQQQQQINKSVPKQSSLTKSTSRSVSKSVSSIDNDFEKEKKVIEEDLKGSFYLKSTSSGAHIHQNPYLKLNHNNNNNSSSGGDYGSSKAVIYNV